MRHLTLACLLFGAAACNVTITADDDGSGGEGGGDCGEPPPPSGGWCPPAWQCIDGAWVDTAGACPEPACPANIPAYGSDCPLIGQVCDYSSDFDCGGWTEAHCTEEGWEVYGTYCSPPLECPEEAPIGGTDCTGWDYAWDCGYTVPTACGDVWMWSYCDTASYTWQSSGSGETCPGCAYDSAAGCESDPACRWAVPGCGGDPIAEEGCYPAGGCADTGCALDEECATVTVDPCWASNCNACGEDFTVCVPSMGGA